MMISGNITFIILRRKTRLFLFKITFRHFIFQDIIKSFGHHVWSIKYCYLDKRWRDDIHERSNAIDFKIHRPIHIQVQYKVSGANVKIDQSYALCFICSNSILYHSFSIMSSSPLDNFVLLIKVNFLHPPPVFGQ